MSDGSGKSGERSGVGPQYKRDKKYQERLRLQQSWYRDQVLSVPYGTGPQASSTQLYGNMLTDESAEAGHNFLTPRIFELAKEAIDGPGLVNRYRLLYNMLTSQTMCFNLFGELACDLDLATRVLAEMTNGRIAQVCSICFEFSPGRGDINYTEDSSAFDVYATYKTGSGGKGFVGIEVKYHESVESVSVEKEQKYYDKHKDRYDKIASNMGCFHEAELEKIRRSRLQQIWRDHLLMHAHKVKDKFDDAIFVFLHPKANSSCCDAVEEYRNCFKNDTNSFLSWTLECFVKCLMNHSSADWIRQFHLRYLDFSRADDLLASKEWT